MSQPPITPPPSLKGKHEVDGTYGNGTLLEYTIIDNEGNPLEGKIIIDAVVEEQHQAQVEVTKYPVQTGFIVSDHIIRRNRTLNLRGVVSNYDYSLMDERIDEINSFEEAIQYMREKQSQQNTNKIFSGFNTLNDICLLGGRVKVYSMIGTYQNCILTQVQTTKNAEVGNGMNVTLVFEEITEVSQAGVKSFKLGAPTPVPEDDAINNTLDKSAQKKGGRT